MSARPEFVETDTTDRPVSLYAATKKSGEVMAHAYAHLFGIPTTVCRFFTVYGPNGRPDMAFFKFVRAILDGEPIEVYGEGRQERDFTYVGDLVEAMRRLVDCVPETGRPVSAEGVTDTLSPVAPYREVNIAGGTPVGLMRYIETIEEVLGRKARLKMLPMQAGDVQADDRVSGPSARADGLQAPHQHSRRPQELRRLVQGRGARQIIGPWGSVGLRPWTAASKAAADRQANVPPAVALGRNPGPGITSGRTTISLAGLPFRCIILPEG